jgi:hypothetical protein
MESDVRRLHVLVIAILAALIAGLSAVTWAYR